MSVIDFHAHCYPGDVWPKVDAAIVKNYNKKAESPGTVEGLSKAMNVSGISLSVVQPVANQGKHVDSVNKWIESIRDSHNDLLFFGAMHPEAQEPYQAVCDLARKGFRGIKMQPNAGKYYPNSEECFKIYQALSENDMILMTHAGDELLPYSPLYAHPKNFVSVFESFPDLRVVLAHLGGYKTWQDLDMVLGYKNVYYDTAMSCEIGDEEFRSLVERIGIDKVLFGTDFPWYNPKKAVDYTRKVLGEKADKVFCVNPRGLLGLE